ncbi:phospholipid transport system substrate-binding protein [Fontimonas thermophila]|uniref:Phospholipid transport system substrate-binding protein n=1 Tax=Fontimonas thermophila TaxID=1076937 RepID=A0A1I2IYC5_9GAMM|nr:ABC transporter substrate-binding protein [Fontimonas thermophila]SFF47294.1 phospholipid transport system substrate-binding protein [Fontimonas thermophila]
MTRMLALLSAALIATATWAAEAPDEMVKRVSSQLQSLIAQNHAAYKADLNKFYATVDDVVVPHFDVPFIARSVLARNWRDASEEQRTRFAQAFKDMLIRSYANALLEYHDSVEAQWKPLRLAPETSDAVVHSALIRKDGKPPVNLSFAVHKVGDEWKIYDIIVENISLVQNFRGQFHAEIKRSGLDAVIARMESGAYGKPGAAGSDGGSTGP